MSSFFMSPSARNHCFYSIFGATRKSATKKAKFVIFLDSLLLLVLFVSLFILLLRLLIIVFLLLINIDVLLIIILV